MKPETKNIEFSKLRIAYVTVKKFLENEAQEEIGSLNTKVVEDLSLSGDDNLEMLERFIKKFELDHQEFKYDDHFHSEGELFGSGAALHNLIVLSIWLPIKTIELLAFKKIELEKPEFFKPDRAVTDMTFRDLITWYVEGQYSNDKNIIYKLETPHNNA
ncbi:MAG: hypothetical protein Crog4KO_13440 [Crocinitomicaceae bacterium]